MSKLVYRLAGTLSAICLCLTAAGAALAVDTAATPATMPALSATTVEVANDLNLMPSVQELIDAEKTEGKDSLKALRLREKLVESVLMASLEIRSATSRIDAEISQTNETRDIMADARERKTEYSDIVNFMTAGSTSIVNNALTEFTTTPSTGGVVGGGLIGVVGGALQIGISTVTLKLQKGEHRSSGIRPNMLAPLFGYAGPEAQYNEGVWSFLNDPYPTAPNESRRQHLVNQWMRIGRIAPLSTARGQRQVGLLTGMVPQIRTITIDLLDDRALMLTDLRAAISQMDIEMLEIMRWVKTL